MSNRQNLRALAPKPTDSLALVEHGKRKLSTTKEIRDYINTLDRHAAPRYQVQCEIADLIMSRHEDREEEVAAYFEWMKEDGAWQAVVSEADFYHQTEEIRRVAETVRVRRNRASEGYKTCVERWGKAITDEFWPMLKKDKWCRCAATLARNCDYPSAVGRINQAMWIRLSQNPGRGKKLHKELMLSDLENASRPDFVGPPLNMEAIHAAGLYVGPGGILAAGAPLSLPAPADPRPPIPLSPPSRNLQPQPPPASPRDSHMTGQTPLPSPRPPQDNRHHSGSVPMSPSAFSPGASRNPGPGSPAPRPRHVSGQSVSSIATSLSNVSLSRFAGLSPEEMAELENQGADKEDPDVAEAVEKRRETGRRGCACRQNVKPALKAQLNDAKELNDSQLVKLLNQLAKLSSPFPLCYHHAVNLGGKIGLLTRGLDQAALTFRLEAVINSRRNLGRIRTANGTFHYFRKGRRPARPEDLLQIYRMKHAALPSIAPPNWASMLKNLGLGGINVDLALNGWGADGSLSLPIFSWLWTETAGGSVPTAYNTLGKMAAHEWDMYSFHQRKDQKSLGWLRTMLHGIVQQIIRQDPVYYAWYVALRPDHQTRLISYPYYAKFARKGDSTFFRHIDVNIRRLAEENHGANMIQGSVSMTNEDHANCTTVVPGMHRCVSEWNRRLRGRGFPDGGIVQDVSPQMLTDQDLRDFKTSWKTVPCKQGDARITMPHIPHGSTGPATIERRTMLPWFVGIQEDGESLEVPESGTWEQLSQANRDLIHGPSTPSGLPVLYGSIPYRFPAAVAVTGLGALSEALVGRRRWDDPLVRREQQILFGLVPDRPAKDYVLAWRKRAVGAAVHAFATVMDAEKQLFGQRSFFYCRCNNIPLDSIVGDRVAAEGDAIGIPVHGREETDAS